MKCSIVVVIGACFVVLTNGSLADLKSESTSDFKGSPEELSRKLSEIATSPLSSATYDAGCQYIRVAGGSGNRVHVANLKLIAQNHSQSDWHEMAFNALYNLWKLGEPTAYFLGNAKAYETNPRLAYYSIVVLAYEPADDVTAGLPRKIVNDRDKAAPVTPESKKRAQSLDLLNSGLSFYGRTSALALQYGKIEKPSEKLIFLEPFVRQTYGPDGDRSGHFSWFVWAGIQFAKLSRQEPLEVAQWIFAFRPSKDRAREESDVKHYQRFLVSLVSEEAKARYEVLLKESR